MDLPSGRPPGRLVVRSRINKWKERDRLGRRTSAAGGGLSISPEKRQVLFCSNVSIDIASFSRLTDRGHVRPLGMPAFPAC